MGREIAAMGEAFGGLSAEMVDPSPDGRWISYVRFPEGTLWKSRADGANASN